MEKGTIGNAWRTAKEKLRRSGLFGQKPRKLNINVLILLFGGWLIPLTLMSVVVLNLASRRMDIQTRDTIETAADTAVEVCEMRLSTAIQASRNASYISTIKDCWYEYQAGGNEQRLYNGVSNFISVLYKYDENFLSTMVYYRERPQELYYIYNSIVEVDYDSVSFFRKKAKQQVDEMAERIDTHLGFLCIEDHLYMVRNIVDKDYTPLATIVMELNQDLIFQSLKGIGWYEDACVYIDDVCVYGQNTKAASVPDEMQDKERVRSVYYDENGASYVCRLKDLDGHKVRYVVYLDHKAIHYESNSMMYPVMLILLFTIPLVAIIFLFLYQNVNAPVRRLQESAREIEKGNFGFQIESKEKSEEFAYLVSAFNSMSGKLQNQFEQIYLEELALKDADIKALQSQINPHFLNNTLEIINWEARMNGNDKVSSMIEALSTMLEATLNRKKQPMILLAEELEYVDAYCYIIKQRFGEKLQFEKEVDQKLLNEEVPRLIIQPIIENAVEHGLAGREGKIGIRIYEKQDKMLIEVINDGTLTIKDKERIDMLLNGKDETNRSVSLGIRNVNKRLKIIYGPECGLTIRNDADGFTISTITVKRHK